MVIVQLIGGLGNQMFQYAAGRKVAHAKNTELLIDTSVFGDYKLRGYGLAPFAISARIARQAELMPFKETWLETFPKKLGLTKNSLLKKVTNSAGGFDTLFKRDDYGHWNNPEFFSGIEETLHKEFALRELQGAAYEEMIAKVRSVHSVSVHVRRGDYQAAKNKLVFTECGPEYYKKAIALLEQKVAGAEYFIFSDDVDWVKENIAFPRAPTYVSGNGFTDVQEMILMAACDNNIIANSTFSWWGAWLNRNPNKIVVAPKEWFIDRRTDDIVPAGWIKI